MAKVEILYCDICGRKCQPDLPPGHLYIRKLVVGHLPKGRELGGAVELQDFCESCNTMFRDLLKQLVKNGVDRTMLTQLMEKARS